MALPRVEIPTYELTLPSRDEKIAFRPFTVKEENEKRKREQEKMK